jgi:hypothetical protein
MTYSSSLAVGRQRYSQTDLRSQPTHSRSPWGKNQNATSFALPEHTLGPISNTIMLIILACLLGLLYLTQVVKADAYSYKINSLNQQQTQLQQEHDDLQTASARLQSLKRVSDSAVAKSLVPVAPSGTVEH